MVKTLNQTIFLFVPFQSDDDLTTFRQELYQLQKEVGQLNAIAEEQSRVIEEQRDEITQQSEVNLRNEAEINQQREVNQRQETEIHKQRDEISRL